MSPIKGLTEQRRLPRIGKIHLGVKKVSQRTHKEYPVATPFFVCPPEVQKVYGAEPKKLDIIIPVEDDELWCPQYYRQYSNARGLVCKGDGCTCRRMIDTGTGAIANRETQTVKWEEGLKCDGRDCPDYQRGACSETMNLQVFLPKVPGLGVWQIDTGSINSIRNINSCGDAVRAACGRVSWIPLTLTLEPTEVINPDDGKKKTVYCMWIRHESGLAELLQAADKPRAQVLISMPADDEAPSDRQLLGPGNHDNKEEMEGVVEDDIEQLYGDEPPPAQKAQPVQPEPPEDEFDKVFGKPGQPAPAAATATATLAPATPRRDPATIKTIEQLARALKEDFGLSYTDQWKELNISHWTKLTITPREAYETVAATHRGPG